MPRALRLLALALCLTLGAVPPSAAQGDGGRVDLELVLAVDSSGSIADDEFRLQMAGIAAAFRDPDIQRAIAEGPVGAIAVALLIWGDSTIPTDAGPWRRIAGPAQAAAFAAEVASFPRRVGGGTGIGAAIADAARMIATNRYAGTRRVVDVSGDGRETPPRERVVLLPQARSMADALGVTVNGLAVADEAPDLAAWYRARVVTGFGAFVIEARTLDDFGAAMRRKLLREIAERPTS